MASLTSRPARGLADGALHPVPRARCQARHQLREEPVCLIRLVLRLHVRHRIHRERARRGGPGGRGLGSLLLGATRCRGARPACEPPALGWGASPRVHRVLRGQRAWPPRLNCPVAVRLPPRWGGCPACRLAAPWAPARSAPPALACCAPSHRPLPATGLHERRVARLGAAHVPVSGHPEVVPQLPHSQASGLLCPGGGCAASPHYHTH